MTHPLVELSDGTCTLQTLYWIWVSLTPHILCNMCRVSSPHLLLAPTYCISHDLYLQPITLGSCTSPLHFFCMRGPPKVNSQCYLKAFHALGKSPLDQSIFGVLPAEEFPSIFFAISLKRYSDSLSKLGAFFWA